MCIGRLPDEEDSAIDGSIQVGPVKGSFSPGYLWRSEEPLRSLFLVDREGERETVRGDEVHMGNLRNVSCRYSCRVHDCCTNWGSTRWLGSEKACILHADLEGTEGRGARRNAHGGELRMRFCPGVILKAGTRRGQTLA